MSDLPGRADRTTYRRPTAPPRRPRRRATSPGTGAVEPTPVEPAPDDSDVGWGDRPPADEETRYLTDRPPHWGSD
ncbi:hypothetical protein SAMN05660199_01888 [Klenkia soli]|uniref:Uncharacterized protein n=1 Tax=Klenkia soli TaxID=1052260 RepID=A0A1H0J7I4_9ACTN|nr:hypothetical protein [Klenkia soli]SDO39572.1 hypothetical protein SAMN05660199_01888 [Klenkia soli]